LKITEILTFIPVSLLLFEIFPVIVATEFKLDLFKKPGVCVLELNAFVLVLIKFKLFKLLEILESVFLELLLLLLLRKPIFSFGFLFFE
jgi:hypothetical protein